MPYVPPPHDESKLPIWAQNRIKALLRDVEEARRRLRNTEEAHSLLLDREWFSIKGSADWGGPRKLWMINKDNPFPICSLGPGDILLVGRAKKEKDSA